MDATLIKSETQPAVARGQRLLALDVVRGYAMLAMLISHSSWLLTDVEYRVAYGWDNLIVPVLGSPASIIGYFLQAATPAFFLLGGFSMALFTASRRRRGWSEWHITRFFLIRGLLLVALDLLVMNLEFTEPHYIYRFSVLTGIGLCVAALGVLRLVPLRVLFAIMIGLLLGTQLYYYLNDWPEEASIIRAIFLAPSLADMWAAQFPVLPWLSVVILGFISGTKLTRGEIDLGRYSFRLGTGLMLAWLVIFWLHNFGYLYAENRWIFGKHPPDLAYLLFYVGLVFWLIALHTRFNQLNQGFVANMLIILGQTALFFYLLHIRFIQLLTPLALQLDVPPLLRSLIITVWVLPLMLMLCYGYRAYKRRHPNSLLQYL